MQLRPPGDPKAPFYNPQRDMAYFYGPFMKEALHGLGEAHWAPGIQEVAKLLGATDDDLCLGVAALMAAHRKFVNAPTVKTPADALEQEGWFALPPVVRVMIYYRMGEVMLGGFFAAVREVTMQAEPPPPACQMADFIAAGRCVAEWMDGQRMQLTDQDQLQLDLEKAKAQCELLQDADRERTKLLDETQIKLAHAGKQLLTAAQTVAVQQAHAEMLERQTFWGFLKMKWRQRHPASVFKGS